MRLTLLALTTVFCCGGCAREGLRPVLSYPRDITGQEAEDIQDQTNIEEHLPEIELIDANLPAND